MVGGPNPAAAEFKRSLPGNTSAADRRPETSSYLLEPMLDFRCG
jgi:hypothetical protein